MSKEAQLPRARSAMLAHLRPEALWVQVELLHSNRKQKQGSQISGIW
jgi:hypothetical protein